MDFRNSIILKLRPKLTISLKKESDISAPFDDKNIHHFVTLKFKSKESLTVIVPTLNQCPQPLVNLFHKLGLSILAGGGWSFLICSKNPALAVSFWEFSTDVASPISRRSLIIFLRIVFFMLRCLSRVLYLCFALLSTLLSMGTFGFSLLSNSLLQFQMSRTSLIFLSFSEDIFHHKVWKKHQ